MEHRVNLDEISDGSLYTLKDTVPLGCDGCRDFSETAKCCRFAEDTITLDAYDIYQLTRAGYRFAELLQGGFLSLLPEDAILLPHLNFEKEQRCPFLSKEGRCGIHAFRPGLCRLFPLARGFREDGIFYLKQIHECPVQKEAPVSVAGWLGFSAADLLGFSNAEDYENFCISWHEILQKQRIRLQNAPDHAALTTLSSRFLRLFFLTPYSVETPFQAQFNERRTTFFEKK